MLIFISSNSVTAHKEPLPRLWYLGSFAYSMSMMDLV